MCFEVCSNKQWCVPIAILNQCSTSTMADAIDLTTPWRAAQGLRRAQQGSPGLRTMTSHEIRAVKGTCWRQASTSSTRRWWPAGTTSDWQAKVHGPISDSSLQSKMPTILRHRSRSRSIQRRQPKQTKRQTKGYNTVMMANPRWIGNDARVAFMQNPRWITA